jgi:acetolactate synthase-1/2/3 large subunit
MTTTTASNRPGGHMTGGRALAEMLRLHEVGPMFGMGGFQLLPFYEAVRALGLRHYLINDERCGAFAADAYARITNRPGVCDGTLGPGATNLVTSLVESLNAGVAMVAITGDSHRLHSWKNMTQESRQLDILRPAVKEIIRIEMAERIPELTRRAFAVATSGRAGPVVLDVPEDVCHAQLDFAPDAFWVDPATLTFPARRARPGIDELGQAAIILASAKRPLILAGGGVHLSDAAATLTQFAEHLSIPVAHTLSGKGAIACTHPLSVGLFGRYSRFANELMDAADCLLVIGCKLGEIATKRYTLPTGNAKLIHLDISPEEFGRTTRADVALWGDAQASLLELAAALGSTLGGKRPERADYVREVAERRERWMTEAGPRYRSDERPIHMARLIDSLNRQLPANGVLVADGGFAAHWAGLFFDTKAPGRGFVADRGLASIGYGLPGALGAQLAAPDAPVVGLTGDGGLNMVIGEIETARRTGANFTLMVVNNAASGYVKALQHAMYGSGNYQSSDLVETNYADVARAFGCRGIRVEDPAELDKAVATGLTERDRPTVIDVVVTRDPARMLPAADNRALQVKAGDRPA